MPFDDNLDTHDVLDTIDTLVNTLDNTLANLDTLETIDTLDTIDTIHTLDNTLRIDVSQVPVEIGSRGVASRPAIRAQLHERGGERLWDGRAELRGDQELQCVFDR